MAEKTYTDQEVTVRLAQQVGIDAVAGETPLPTAEQLAIIADLDPHGIRHTMLKDNPPAQGVKA